VSSYACVNFHVIVLCAICKGSLVLRTSGCCDTPSLRRISTTNSFGAHPQFIPRHNTLAKKKTNDSTSTEPPTYTENAIVPSANVGNSEGASVDHVTEGEFKVELHDLGISPKDIKAVRRIEAHLAERSCNAW
jgi:hypothetical protein